jgi:hypothetical protein
MHKACTLELNTSDLKSFYDELLRGTKCDEAFGFYKDFKTKNFLWQEVLSSTPSPDCKYESSATVLFYVYYISILWNEEFWDLYMLPSIVRVMKSRRP